ncbi:MAG: sensor domain-containing diguanylate cyclase [Arcobacteraceae bacterium]|nr:sensor domain-containing diguanylate cyclase [Arcobacteraceae bacterium]
MLTKVEYFSPETISFLKSKQSFITDEFLERNLLSQTIKSANTSDIKYNYQIFLNNLCNGNLKKLLTSLVKLTRLYIQMEIPYVVLLNELNHLQSILIELFINYDKKIETIALYKLSAVSQNKVAKEYLNIYTTNLISICNIRLSSIHDMLEHYVVEHYVEHIKWLINLAQNIKDTNINSFPQTDKTLCNFGKWLAQDGSNIIKNNSKLKELEKVHSQIHYISSQIKHILTLNDHNYDYDILLTYLEKCELLSLSIGTELALIDNTIVNQKAAKDTLTGALGRQVLEQIFQNQYEISLATSSKFVVAMFDLDYFKKINDNYGHIAGDKVLQEFIIIVKSHIRNSDIIIRYGGEEFVLILPAITTKDAYNVLEKIRKSFENFTLSFENNNINTTVSIGMIEIEAKDSYNKHLLEEYIHLADTKLYKAKQNGRNNIKK